MTATPEDYQWAESPDDEFMALTLTWTLFTGDFRELLRAGGHNFRPRSSTSVKNEGEFDFHSENLLVDRNGPWVLFIAPNGFEYSLPGTVAGLARLGRVVSVFWNVEAVMHVLVTDECTIMRSFGLLLYEQQGAMPEGLGLPLGVQEVPIHAASLAFAERVTGKS
jgi:hypothetical protein